MTLGTDIWQQAILPLTATIQDAILNLDRVAIKIAMVVDEEGHLEGTISDGDIRRGLLKGLGMESSLSEIVHRNPLVVPVGMPRDAVLNLMLVNKVQQVPVVDEESRVVGLHLWEEVAELPMRSNLMVVMAGGKGTRLRPYTEECPKPMVPVAGKPMMQHIIDRAKSEGITRFVLAVHYLGHMIEDHFGDGSKYGVEIVYLKEESPLGTAGALSLLVDRPDEPFLVSNGDVLTDIRYGELLDFHIRHNATATMAVRRHEWQHPFGVVHTRGIDIVAFEEKPVYQSYINAGVYAFSPKALGALPANRHCDMPTFFERLQAAEQQTIAYPMHEPWLDVGRPEDLSYANATVIENSER